MKSILNKNKIIKIAKPLMLPVLVLLILFILIDDILMPLYVQKTKIIRVPNVIGLPVEEARIKLIQTGLKPKEADYKVDARYKEGTIITQNPQPESEVKLGRGVYLTISSGEERIIVPNLRGKSLRDATFSLERHRLKMGNIRYETSDDIFPNTIISQVPSAYSNVKVGTSIDVVVSMGSSSGTAPVPDLSLKTLTEAEKIVNSSGFRLGKISYEVDTNYLPNTILEQRPAAGEIIQLGQEIDIIIAKKEDKQNEDGN